MSEPRFAERPGTVPRDLYDALKSQLEQALKRAESEFESHRFYKREWESTCERCNYASEERKELSEKMAALEAELANALENLQFSNKRFHNSEHERDQLRERVRELEAEVKDCDEQNRNWD